MLAAQNILTLKMVPVVTPSQDMVLGNYYLTLERKDAVILVLSLMIQTKY